MERKYIAQPNFPLFAAFVICTFDTSVVLVFTLSCIPPCDSPYQSHMACPTIICPSSFIGRWSGTQLHTLRFAEEQICPSPRAGMRSLCKSWRRRRRPWRARPGRGGMVGAVVVGADVPAPHLDVDPTRQPRATQVTFRGFCTGSGRC